jgi:histidinol dehydrogenase
MPFAHHKNQPQSQRRAHALRQTGSIVEKLLWRAVPEQEKQFDVKFRYQHPISPYVVDFACLAARLVVEIDGMSHDSNIERDRERQKYLEQQGFKIVRFSNADVLKDVTAIAVTMCEEARQLQETRWDKNPSPNAQSAFDPPARGG